MMKVGSLSEAYIATNRSGNEAIVPRPIENRRRNTQVNSHNHSQASLYGSETVFWEDIQLQGPCCNDI